MATHSITTNRAKNSSDEPEVLLADEHDEAGDPRDQHRAEVAGLGQPAAGPTRHVAMASSSRRSTR